MDPSSMLPHSTFVTRDLSVTAAEKKINWGPEQENRRAVERKIVALLSSFEHGTPAIGWRINLKIQLFWTLVAWRCERLQRKPPPRKNGRPLPYIYLCDPCKYKQDPPPLGMGWGGARVEVPLANTFAGVTWALHAFSPLRKKIYRYVIGFWLRMRL